MTNSMGSRADRRRARQFATLVDGGRVRAQHDLQPLVDLVAGLQPPHVEPLPEFRSYLRDRLVYATNEGGSPVPALTTGAARDIFAPSRPWRELVATAAAITLMTGAGAAAASTRAHPGDGLYPLKRSIESIQIVLATSDLERGRELLERAEHRLAEAERLLASAGSLTPAEQAVLDELLAAMQADALAGSDAMLKAYSDEGDVDALVALDEFVRDERNRLNALVVTLEPARRAQIDDMIDNLAALQAQIAAVIRPWRSPAPRDSDDSVAIAKLKDLLGVTGKQPNNSSTNDRVDTPNHSSSDDDDPLSALPLPLGIGSIPEKPRVPVGVSQNPGAPPENVARPTPNLPTDRLPDSDPVARPGPGDRPDHGATPPGAPPVDDPVPDVPPVVVPPSAPVNGGGNSPINPGNPPVNPGIPPVDAGKPPVDVGTPPVRPGDLPGPGTPQVPGTPPVDIGKPPVDAGNPPVDAGSPPVDAGKPPVRPGNLPGPGSPPVPDTPSVPGTPTVPTTPSVPVTPHVPGTPPGGADDDGGGGGGGAAPVTPVNRPADPGNLPGGGGAPVDPGNLSGGGGGAPVTPVNRPADPGELPGGGTPVTPVNRPTDPGNLLPAGGGGGGAPVDPGNLAGGGGGGGAPVTPINRPADPGELPGGGGGAPVTPVDSPADAGDLASGGGGGAPVTPINSPTDAGDLAGEGGAALVDPGTVAGGGAGGGGQKDLPRVDKGGGGNRDVVVSWAPAPEAPLRA